MVACGSKGYCECCADCGCCNGSIVIVGFGEVQFTLAPLTIMVPLIYDATMV